MSILYKSPARHPCRPCLGTWKGLACLECLTANPFRCGRLQRCAHPSALTSSSASTSTSASLARAPRSFARLASSPPSSFALSLSLPAAARRASPHGRPLIKPPSGSRRCRLEPCRRCISLFAAPVTYCCISLLRPFSTARSTAATAATTTTRTSPRSGWQNDSQTYCRAQWFYRPPTFFFYVPRPARPHSHLHCAVSRRDHRAACPPTPQGQGAP